MQLNPSMATSIAAERMAASQLPDEHLRDADRGERVGRPGRAFEELDAWVHAYVVVLGSMHVDTLTARLKRAEWCGDGRPPWRSRRVPL
jgi:hypothetical protein